MKAFALLMILFAASECCAAPCGPNGCRPQFVAIEPECRCLAGGKCDCKACECAAEETCFKGRPVRTWFKKHFGRCK